MHVQVTLLHCYNYADQLRNELALDADFPTDPLYSCATRKISQFFHLEYNICGVLILEQNTCIFHKHSDNKSNIIEYSVQFVAKLKELPLLNLLEST